MVGPLGGSEVILILALALLLFGPRKLPEIGRTIGRTLAQFRRAATDFRADLEREIKVDDLRETRKNLKTVEQEIDKAASEIREPAVGTILGTGAAEDPSSRPPGAPVPPARGPSAEEPDEPAG